MEVESKSPEELEMQAAAARAAAAPPDDSEAVQALVNLRTTAVSEEEMKDILTFLQKPDIDSILQEARESIDSSGGRDEVQRSEAALMPVRTEDEMNVLRSLAEFRAGRPEAPPAGAPPAAALLIDDGTKAGIIGRLFPPGAAAAPPAPPKKYGFDILDEGPANPLFCHVFFINALLTVLDPMCHDGLYPKDHPKFKSHYTRIMDRFSAAFTAAGCADLVEKFKRLTMNPGGDSVAKAIMNAQVNELLARLGVELAKSGDISYNDLPTHLNSDAFPTGIEFVFDSATGDIGDAFKKVSPAKRFTVGYSPAGAADPGPSGKSIVDKAGGNLTWVVQPRVDFFPPFRMPFCRNKGQIEWMDGIPPGQNDKSTIVRHSMNTDDGPFIAHLNNRGPSIENIQKIVSEMMGQVRLEIGGKYNNFTITPGSSGRALFTWKTAPGGKPSGGVFNVEFGANLLNDPALLTLYIANYKHEGDANVLGAAGYSKNNTPRVKKYLGTVEFLGAGTAAIMAESETGTLHMGRKTARDIHKREPTTPPTREECETVIDRINTLLGGAVSGQTSRTRRQLTARGSHLFDEALKFAQSKVEAHLKTEIHENWESKPYAQILRSYVLMQIELNIEMNLKHNDVFVNPAAIAVTVDSMRVLDGVYRDQNSLFEKLCEIDLSVINDAAAFMKSSKKGMGGEYPTDINSVKTFLEDIIGIDEYHSTVAGVYFDLYMNSAALNSKRSIGRIERTFKITELITESEARVASLEFIDKGTFRKQIVADYLRYREVSGADAVPGKEYAWIYFVHTLRNGYSDKAATIEKAAERLAVVTEARERPSVAERVEDMRKGARESARDRVRTAVAEAEAKKSGIPMPINTEGVPGKSPKGRRGRIGGTLKRSHQCPDCQQALADRQKRRTRRKRRHGEPKVTVEIVAL